MLLNSERDWDSKEFGCPFLVDVDLIILLWLFNLPDDFLALRLSHFSLDLLRFLVNLLIFVHLIILLVKIVGYSIVVLLEN